MKGIKIKVDVMDILKQIQKHCEQCKCLECEFALPENSDCYCALYGCPCDWKIKESKR